MAAIPPLSFELDDTQHLKGHRWTLHYQQECSRAEQPRGRAELILLPDGESILARTLESIPRFDGLFDTVWIEHLFNAGRLKVSPRIYVTTPHPWAAIPLERYAARYQRTRAIV